MHSNLAKLEAMIALVVKGLDYQWVGMEYLNQGRHSVLRIFIDKEGGVTVEDCQVVSHQVSGMLDVEDPVGGTYSLEVSSPGLARPLFKMEDYQRFVGQEVVLQLNSPLSGQRNFRGKIHQVESEQVVLDMNGKLVELPFANIRKAHLSPVY